MGNIQKNTALTAVKHSMRAASVVCVVVECVIYVCIIKISMQYQINLFYGIFVVLYANEGWTGKDGAPFTLATIIKKSYNGSNILSTSLGSKPSCLGLGGNQY